MMKSFIVVLFTVTIADPTVASAQSLNDRLSKETDKYTARTGIYVPKLVRNQAFKSVAQELDKPLGTDMRAISRLATVSAPAYAQSDPADRAAQSLGLWLEKFPTVQVIVTPKPPQDFQLTINGEACPSTEKALYRVPSGQIVVKVWRKGTTVCEKTYTAAPGSVYEVACTF